MLTPSMGFCSIPSITSGMGIPVASRIVGAISMTWWNWCRMPPLSLITSGQAMAIPCLVPPKCELTILVHVNGVPKAQVQPIDIWG
jgi:hypothetical protein